MDLIEWRRAETRGIGIDGGDPTDSFGLLPASRGHTEHTHPSHTHRGPLCLLSSLVGFMLGSWVSQSVFLLKERS